MKFLDFLIGGATSIAALLLMVWWIGSSTEAGIAKDCREMGQSRLTFQNVVIDCSARAAP